MERSGPNGQLTRLVNSGASLGHTKVRRNYLQCEALLYYDKSIVSRYIEFL